jgi:hypothetical protein
VTLEQLRDAFAAERIDESLEIRPPGATEWSTLGELLARASQAPPPVVAKAAASARPPPAPVPVAVAAPAVQYDLTPPPRKPRPVLGPSLVVAGVLLWAFVVLGTYTTSWLSGGGAPLSPGLAGTLAVVLTLSACSFAERRSRSAPIAGVQGPTGRFVVVAFVGVCLWLAAVVMATIIGRLSGPNLDALIAAVLLITAALAVLAGDRMVARTRLPRSAGLRALVLIGWLGVGMITLGSCVELVSEF